MSTDNLVRDPDNNSLINNDKPGYSQRVSAKKKAMSDAKRLNKIEADIVTIKNTLKQLMEK